MAGLGANTFYNLVLGGTMFVGRYAAIVPTLALAGFFAAKPRNDSTRGTLRTDTALFGVLLIVNIIIVGALTFLPADALGPVAEHLVMLGGRTF